MLHHPSFPQTLASRRRWVGGARSRRQAFFRRDRKGARPFPPHAWRAPPAGRADGRGQHEMSALTVSRRVICPRRLPGRAAHCFLLQVDDQLALGETTTLARGRYLGRQPSRFVGQGAPRRPTPVGTVAHRFHPFGFPHPLALRHQVQRFLLVAGIARQHFHPTDQRAVPLDRHRRLVPVETLAGTLGPVPHLGVRDPHHPILLPPFLEATALRLLLHLL